MDPDKDGNLSEEAIEKVRPAAIESGYRPNRLSAETSHTASNDGEHLIARLRDGGPSRALARKLKEDAAFRVLAAGNFPSHRTRRKFRRRHLRDFKEMFAPVALSAREAGLACIGKRTATAPDNMEWQQDIHRWPGLKAVVRIEAVRVAEGGPPPERSSTSMSRKMFPAAIGNNPRQGVGRDLHVSRGSSGQGLPRSAARTGRGRV